MVRTRPPSTPANSRILLPSCCCQWCSRIPFQSNMSPDAPRPTRLPETPYSALSPEPMRGPTASAAQLRPPYPNHPQIHIISNEMYPTISKLTTWPSCNQAKAKLTVPGLYLYLFLWKCWGLSLQLVLCFLITSLDSLIANESHIEP